MAMSRLLAKNLGRSKTPKTQVISEFADKASPVSKKPRNGSTSRRRRGKKNDGE